MPQVKVDIQVCDLCGRWTDSEGLIGTRCCFVPMRRVAIPVEVEPELLTASGQLRDARHRIRLRGGLLAARALEEPWAERYFQWRKALMTEEYPCPGPSGLTHRVNGMHPPEGTMMTPDTCLEYPDCRCGRYLEQVDKLEGAECAAPTGFCDRLEVAES